VTPILIGLVVFGLTSCGVLSGLWLRTRLPEHYLNAESRDSIKLGTGLIATMTALVLGLVTAAAKSSFDSMDSVVKQVAMQTLALDRLLARYGNEASGIRQRLRQVMESRADTIWHSAASSTKMDPSGTPALAEAEQITDAIRQLTPADDKQRALQAKAIDVSESLLQSRWSGLTNSNPSVPKPFLAVLVFWLAFLYLTFGLLSSRNLLVTVVLLVCALSVASAMFLVLEMDSPFDGLIRVSAEPLQKAIARLNQ
jgi:hypothetical protein